jgi:hypothetical protein
MSEEQSLTPESEDLLERAEALNGRAFAIVTRKGMAALEEAVRRQGDLMLVREEASIVIDAIEATRCCTVERSHGLEDPRRRGRMWQLHDRLIKYMDETSNEEME